MAHLEDAGRRSSERASDTSLELPAAPQDRRIEPWISLLIVLVFLTVWEVLSRSGRISALFFPAPSVIIYTLIELISDGKLAPHLVATLGRIMVGFILGAVPGLILGLTMGWSPRVKDIVDPIIAALHPMPKIAIFPLILVIFGIGDASKIAAIAVAVFFPMLINCMAGVRQINPVYFEVTKNYGANLWKTFTRVVFPGSLPLVLTGARLAINVAMVIAIAVELIAANQGLGVLIWFSWQTLRIEELYAALVVTGLLGIVINLALQWISKRLAPWYHPQLEKGS
jgi:NitT/TauT family transport system permease protein